MSAMVYIRLIHCAGAYHFAENHCFIAVRLVHSGTLAKNAATCTSFGCCLLIWNRSPACGLILSQEHKEETMTYSPNDRGPDIPPTRGSARSGALWVVLAVVLLVGGFLWYNASGPQTDPGTTASTTSSSQTIAPSTPAPAQTGAGNAQPATGTTGGAANSSQP